LALYQLAHQLDRRSSVTPALDEDVEDLALVVDGAPEIHPHAADPDHHLIEMPPRSRTRTALAESSREHRPELEDPTPDRLVRDIETPRGEQLLDVAVAQGEAEIQPDGVLDDEGREPVPAIAGRDHPAMLPPFVAATGYRDKAERTFVAEPNSSFEKQRHGK
jgi:hypothetical protein